jgi:uncharacterized protein (TIGR00369 family)
VESKVSEEVGFRRWLGVEYREISDKRAVVSVRLDAEKRNIRGVAHGGVVASIVDIAMGTAASGGNYQNRSRLVVTVELKINYLAPATGNELVAVAEVVRLGSRAIVTRCEVITDAGDMCATALGTFIVRRPHTNDPVRLR